MTIVFFGSSDFSIPALKACLDSPHEVILVVSTPDQKKGRGLKLHPTPVKTFALEHKLPVEAPDKLKDSACFERVKKLKPDLFVVSSYGKFIPSAWLTLPSKLSLNVHPSLLPKYRGASPINRPILNGDDETGVSIIEVTSKLDSGDIFSQLRYPLDPRIDAEQLSEVLAEKSYGLLAEIFGQIERGILRRVPQSDSDASYADKLVKEDGHLIFSDPAAALDRKIRGLKPWPVTFTMFQGEPLQILDGFPENEKSSEKPGTLLQIGKEGSISVATGDGVLKILRVKPAGKKEMNAADFIRGRRLEPGFAF